MSKPRFQTSKPGPYVWASMFPPRSLGFEVSDIRSGLRHFRHQLWASTFQASGLGFDVSDIRSTFRTLGPGFDVSAIRSGLRCFRYQVWALTFLSQSSYRRWRGEEDEFWLRTFKFRLPVFGIRFPCFVCFCQNHVRASMFKASSLGFQVSAISPES